MKCSWQGYEFQLIQGGKGIISKNISGHIHSKNSYELHYIVSGKGLLRTDQKEYPLSEGIFFVTGPDIYHEQITKIDEPLTEVHCYLQGTGKKTNDILVAAFLDHPFYIGKHKKFKRYFQIIADELQEMTVGYESMVECTLVHILTEYARSLVDRYKIPQLISASDLNDKRFLQIEMEFMNNCHKVTLASLAEKIGLCERQTQRLIEKYYGMNFTQIKKSIMDKQKKQQAITIETASVRRIHKGHRGSKRA